MDYFCNNPEAFASQGVYYENIQGFDSSSSNSPQVCVIRYLMYSWMQMNDRYNPQNFTKTIQYANTNMGVFQATQESWAPLDISNLVSFDEDRLPTLEPDSSGHSIDGEKEGSQNTKLVCYSRELCNLRRLVFLTQELSAAKGTKSGIATRVPRA